jgi:SAM-dependent methyltransferase
MTFFDAHAPRYLQEVFTRNTEAEVRLLLDEHSLPPGARILDVGCGVGRHAIPLAQAGLRVVGIDLSLGMLRQAQARATEAGVHAEWVQADAAEFGFGGMFDAAIGLCEGAFGLLGPSDDPHTHEQQILHNLQASLAPGARLIMTVPNGMAKNRSAGKDPLDPGTFDPLTLVESFALTTQTPDGELSIPLRERGFVPSELRLMPEGCGFRAEQFFGGTAGRWERRPIDLDEIEIMVIARRRESSGGVVDRRALRVG